MQDRRWTVFYPSQDGTGEGVMMQLPQVQRNVPARPSPAQPSPAQPRSAAQLFQSGAQLETYFNMIPPAAQLR